MSTAVIAQTQERANTLAWMLGTGGRAWVFGADSQKTFEGIRATRVLIDERAILSDDFLDTIYATVAKTPGGQVVRVAAQTLPREEF